MVLNKILSKKNKILTKEELAEWSEEIRYNGFYLSTTNGTFDIIHKGHIATFQKAKELADILIVGVNSDDSVRNYKPWYKPINNERDRAFILSQLCLVDGVYIFNETTPNDFIKTARPHYHVKSKEGYLGLEKPALEEAGATLVLIPNLEGYSCSGLYKEILRRGVKHLWDTGSWIL